MPAESTLNIKMTAEEAQAFSAFNKVIAQQTRMRQTNDQTNKSLAQTGKQAEITTGSVLKMVGAWTGMNSVQAILQKSMDALEQYEQHLTAIADRANEASKGLTAFYALNADQGATGRKFVADTVLDMADKYGLKPEETGAIAQPIQSVADLNQNKVIDTEEEQKMFSEGIGGAALLSNQGVPAESAKRVIATGISRGVPGFDMASRVETAADASVMDVTQFAPALPELYNFDDLNAGLAAIATLSKEETDPGKIPRLVRNAGAVLSPDKEDEGIQKKYKLTGTFEEKLATLSGKAAEQAQPGESRDDAIERFTRRLGSQGVTSDLESKALGMLMRSQDDFQKTLNTVNKTDPTLIHQKQAALEADPAQKLLLDTKRQEALAQTATLFGPEAESGRERKEERMSAGAKRISEGDTTTLFGTEAVDEKGQETWGGKIDRKIGEGFRIHGAAMQGQEELNKVKDEIYAPLDVNQGKTVQSMRKNIDDTYKQEGGLPAAEKKISAGVPVKTTQSYIGVSNEDAARIIEQATNKGGYRQVSSETTTQSYSGLTEEQAANIISALTGQSQAMKENTAALLGSQSGTPSPRALATGRNSTE